MPTPKKGESRNKFIARAIPIIIKEGKSKEQAIGKAEGMYSNWLKKRRKG